MIHTVKDIASKLDVQPVPVWVMLSHIDKDQCHQFSFISTQTSLGGRVSFRDLRLGLSLSRDFEGQADPETAHNTIADAL